MEIVRHNHERLVGRGRIEHTSIDTVWIASERDSDDLPHMTFELVRWRLRWMLPALVLLTVAMLAGLLAAARADAGAQQSTEVIVQLRDGTSLDEGRALVRSVGGTVSRELSIINGLGAVVSPAAAEVLERDTRVRAVSANAPVASSGQSLSTPSLLQTAFNQSVRAEKAWAKSVVGWGVGVAVVDTGIAGQLPDFKISTSDPHSRVIASAVVNPNARTAGDTYGHGTHVAGLIAGNGNNRTGADPFDADYVGTAPYANLISIKVADEEGNASLIDVIDGIQFAVEHKADYNIRVLNLSLNSTVAESYKTDPLDAAVEEAWFSGIVVVTAAGNAGTADDAVSYAPANDPYVITVGAVDDEGTDLVLDDQLASWSSRGTTQDGIRKPEILAPGAHVVSTMSSGSAYTTMCPTCMVGTDYMQLGGTSMSAAVISGVVADILQARPSWTPDQV
jgi:serine protease AprX